ncbi:MAG: translocation/assembly module TamB domain-containing protein [Bacteroidales bacterium]|nr:translocation/assembly module TamB domain-containing protein [Bacteroidales bacterium]
MLQSPRVQTALARNLAARLNEGIDGELTIGRVQVLPFKTLILRDVVLTDNDPLSTSFFEPRDTIARIGIATVSFSLKGLTGKKPVTLDKVVVRDGKLNLVTEDHHKTNLKRVFHLSEPKPLEDKGDVLRIKRIEARNFNFTLSNALGKKKPKGHPGINWADLDLKADAKAHDFHITGGKIGGILDDARAKEKSGYSFRNTKGKVEVSRGKVQINDFELTDAESHLNVPLFRMTFDDYRSWDHFVDDVTLEAQLRNSHLGSGTLTGFTGARMPKLEADISKAHFLGTVNDFDLSSFSFREKSGISGGLNGKVSGITHPADSYIDARIQDLQFTTAALGKIIESVAPGKGSAISKYAPGEPFVLDGKLSGPARDLSLTCDLSSPSGGLSGSVKARDLLEKDLPSRLSGSIAVNNFDIGGLLGTDEVKECTLRTWMDASLGKGGVKLGIDSLHIDKAVIHGYEYSNIAGAGTYKDDTFNGRVVCSDPNLNFLFQGLVNLSPKNRNALYKFYFNLGYADLNALGLDKRGPSKASLAVNANFTKTGKDNILGDVDIRNVRLENQEGPHDIGDISIRSFDSNEKQRLTLNSAFADASYTGTLPVTRFIKALADATLGRELPALSGKGTSDTPSSEEGRITLKTYDTRDLLSFVLPGLYIADGTTMNLRLKEDGTLSSDLKSQRIAFKDKYIKNLGLRATDDGEQLLCDLTGEELSAAVKLLGNALQIRADDNRVDLSFGFDNPGEQESNGTIRLACDLDRDADRQLTYDIHVLPSEVVIGGERWGVDSTDISVRQTGVKVPEFVLRNGDQRMEVRGGVSQKGRDTLSVDLNRFNLEPLKALLPSLPDLSGFVSGRARLVSPVTKDRLDLDADLTATETTVSGYDAGTLHLLGLWSNENKEMTFSLQDEIGDQTTLFANGSYRPSNRQLKARARLDSLQAGYASGFLKTVFSKMEGKLSGDFSVIGPLDRLSLSSRGARLDDAVLQIAFTNVAYYLNGPFHIDDYGITFDDISLRDRYRGTGTVSGGIQYDHLKDFRMATAIRVNGVEAFNTQDDGESPVYGNVSASGTVNLSGPFSALWMDINARTDGAGTFHIPLRSRAGAYGTELLTFKKPVSDEWVDPYEEMLKGLEKKEKGKGKLALKMRVSVRPEVQCDLELDKESGNVLSGRGNGTINLDVGGEKAFNITGDYTLSAGDFHLNVMNIASKNFQIDGGSSIKFNGDIMDSDLDIDARYQTKTSLANLIADSTATSYRRNVECRLKVYDKLRNPQLSFYIDIPDLDPSTKSQVESALNTTDKVQKQFVALLVTNSFLPSDQSGIFNNSNMLMSNMMEVMSGQLSNILQRLQIPLDLGLKYAEGEGGTDLFDVAVSTKLFNDRVSVNGVIGNRQYAADGGNQDVVGDLDVEIKLDKAGEIRLNLFSHSADKYSNYLDYSQRNGVGIGYQREFNTFRGLVRSIFTSKKKRQELQSQPRPEEKKSSLKIEKDE